MKRTIEQADLCGVWSHRDELRQKTRQPRFAAWWKKLLDDMHGQDEPKLDELAIAYAISGDDELGQKALKLLREKLPGFIPLADPHAEANIYPELSADLVTAQRSKDLAYTYSFLDPLLEQADRRNIFAELRERGGGLIHRETLGGAWWGNAPNSNWNSLMHSGMALSAVVVMQEYSEEAQAWLDTATRSMQRMLDLAGPEGAGIEGLGYWFVCFRSVQQCAEALRTLSIADWYEHPFWRRCVDFPLYMSRPDRSGLINFSDTGDVLGSSEFFYAIARALRHGLAQWFGDRCFERGEPTIWDLIYYDATVTPTPPNNLPTDRLFKTAHVASFRSGWNDDATFFIFKGGSNAWSHCHLDLNSFFIDAHGERLVVDPGLPQYSNHYFTSVEPEISTSWHNTLVVDGADQRQPARYRMSFDLEEGGDAYCRLGDFFSDDAIGMVRGDATTAYADTLDRFYRHVVYLKPDCFVIYDDIRAKEARTQRHYQWLLHSLSPIEENADGTLEVSGKRARLIIHPVLPLEHFRKFPAPRVPTAVREKDRKPHYCLSLCPQWHHLWNVSPTRSPYPQWDERCASPPLYGRDLQFLVVLTVLPTGTRYEKTIKPVVTDAVHGVEIAGGPRRDRVYFNRRDDAFQVDGVTSDGRKVVLREEDGRTVSSAMIGGRTLTCDGWDLPASSH